MKKVPLKMARPPTMKSTKIPPPPRGKSIFPPKKLLTVPYLLTACEGPLNGNLIMNNRPTTVTFVARGGGKRFP